MCGPRRHGQARREGLDVRGAPAERPERGRSLRCLHGVGRLRGLGLREEGGVDAERPVPGGAGRRLPGPWQDGRGGGRARRRSRLEDHRTALPLAGHLRARQHGLSGPGALRAGGRLPGGPGRGHPDRRRAAVRADGLRRASVRRGMGQTLGPPRRHRRPHALCRCPGVGLHGKGGDGPERQHQGHAGRRLRGERRDRAHRRRGARPGAAILPQGQVRRGGRPRPHCAGRRGGAGRHLRLGGRERARERGLGGAHGRVRGAGHDGREGPGPEHQGVGHLRR
mmetsp:Transcript_71996/g.214880  ORF Transcript_71996/g.214880 Transcript_71996/m.214880 type:complete len:281 (+) Transcript_71996:388-1230(+)